MPYSKSKLSAMSVLKYRSKKSCMKLKKHILLYLFFSLVVVSVSAQNDRSVKFGILGGLSSYNIDPSAVIVHNTDGIGVAQLAFKDATYGFHFGVFVIAKSGFLFMKPQVQFNSQTVSYSYENISSGKLNILDETYQNIDIPLQFGLNIGPVRLGIGPVGHIHIDGKSDFFNLKDVDYRQEFKEMTFGYVMGLGLDIWNFHADLSYEGNLSKLGSHIVLYGHHVEFDTAPARFLLTLGVSF